MFQKTSNKETVPYRIENKEVKRKEKLPLLLETKQRMEIITRHKENDLQSTTKMNREDAGGNAEKFH